MKFIEMYGVYTRNCVYVFDGVQESPVRTIESRGNIDELVLSSNAEYIACATNDGTTGYVDVFGFDTGNLFRRIDYRVCIRSMCSLKSGEFACGTNAMTVLIQDPNTNDYPRVINDTFPVYGLAALIDGFRIISFCDSVGYGVHELHVWNTKTLELERTISMDRSVWTVKVSPVSGLIAVMDNLRWTYVYTADTSGMIHMINGRRTPLNASLTFSYDGLSVILGGEHEVLRFSPVCFTGIEEFDYGEDMRNDLLELPDGRLIGVSHGGLIMSEVKPMTGPITCACVKRTFRDKIHGTFIIPDYTILL
jgi:hypothetical protein